jgi:hypothetical protein
MPFIEVVIHFKALNGGHKGEIDSQNLTGQWIHLRTGREEGIISDLVFSFKISNLSE